MKYNSDFRYDLRRGQDAEKWLGGTLEANDIEVKRDFKAKKTKRVFIEYRCSGKDSGIMTSEADYWAFVLDGGLVIMLPTESVRKITLQAIEKKKVMPGGDGNRARGALVDIRDLVQEAIEIEKLTPE